MNSEGGRCDHYASWCRRREAEYRWKVPGFAGAAWRLCLLRECSTDGSVHHLQMMVARSTRQGRQSPADLMELTDRRTVVCRRDPVELEYCYDQNGLVAEHVPYGADQTVYLVVDRFSSGSVYRETEIERADLETIIGDFMTGQFNDPVRVVAFNTLEHWADDVSGISLRTSRPLRHCGRPRARASQRLRRELRPDDATLGAPTGLRFTTIAAVAPAGLNAQCGRAALIQ